MLRTIFRLCPLCTYMPPSKLVDVLSWETHSSPTRPKAPSTPILAEMPTNVLVERTTTKNEVDMPSKLRQLRKFLETRKSKSLLWFNITSQGELRPVPKISTTPHPEWVERGHVDVQLDRQSRKWWQDQFFCQHNCPLVYPNLLTLRWRR